MNSEILAEQLTDAISVWQKDTDKLVVAIDGYTGIGKTTLLKNLARINSDLLVVNRDDFMLPRKVVEDLLKKADDKSKVFELQVCDNKRIKELISGFRQHNVIYHTEVYNEITGQVDIPKDFDLSKKVLVIEGVFMFHPELLNRLWDKRVYLKGDIQKIDERRVKREKEKWGDSYFPETHPDSYFRQVTIALKRYVKMYKPEELADLVINVD